MVWQVQVTLAETAELEVSASTDEVYGGCICADEAKTFRWGVRATSLGTEHQGHAGTPALLLGDPLGGCGGQGGWEQMQGHLASSPLHSMHSHPPHCPQHFSATW